MTNLALRDYQREAIEHIEAAFARGTNRQLVVLPTGAGKTVVFSHLAKRRSVYGRTLIIAHRDELLTQAQDKLFQVDPSLTVGVVKAARDEHHAENDVIVASIQTLSRPKRLAPLIGTIATVIIDEAHHAAAKTYRDVLTDLGCFEPDGPLAIGFTATAGRGDGIGLGAVWQEIVYKRGIIHMIAEKYLVDVKGLEVMTDLDFGQVSTSRGDYADASLGHEMTESGAIEASAVAYERYAKERRGVAFTPTIATAHDLAKHLTARGIPAEALSGETPTDERRAILRRLHSGDTQVVANCAVLTEGFDEPALSCALIARPTRSRVMFTQMAGRVLRKHPGKDDALILGLFAPPDAGLATIADLSGLPVEDQPKMKPNESLAEAMLREEMESQAFGRKRGTTLLTAKQISLFAKSGLRWVPSGKGFALPCGQTMLLLVPEGDDKYRVVEDLRRGSPRVLSTGQTLEWAQGIGEEYARSHGGVIAQSAAAWRLKPVSPSQQATLRRMKLSIPKTSGEASDAISAANANRVMARMSYAV